MRPVCCEEDESLSARLSYEHACAFAGLYLVLKCSQILEKVSNLLKCSKALLRQQIPYGKVPTPDETSEVGNQCSICQVNVVSCFLQRSLHALLQGVYLIPLTTSHQHIIEQAEAGLQWHRQGLKAVHRLQEPMCNPVKLDACSHIFCSDCISEWFERSVNCPICRAVAKPQGVLAGCDGSTSLLPVVF